MAGYDYDFRVAQLGESEIGPAIHHLTLSDLTSTLPADLALPPP